MKVAEMFELKYRELVKNMNGVTYRNFKARSEYENKHIAELMYMALEITQHDIKANGGYGGELYTELQAMHKSKLVASNKHRQEHGHIDRYWLTKKGFKALNQTENII